VKHCGEAARGGLHLLGCEPPVDGRVHVGTVPSSSGQGHR
jgi:hypothetical protein